jgi:hypothetical protein
MRLTSRVPPEVSAAGASPAATPRPTGPLSGPRSGSDDCRPGSVDALLPAEAPRG